MGTFDDLKPKSVFGDLKGEGAQRAPSPVTFNPASYSGAPDEPLSDQGIGPLEWMTLANPATRAMQGAKVLTEAAPWLFGAAARGAAAAGTYGALESAARLGRPGNRPLAQTGAAALSGAVLGPPAESVAGLIGRALTPRPGVPGARVRPGMERPAASPDAKIAPAPAPMVEPRNPLTGKSSQQYPGVSEEQASALRADPEFIRRIGQLGGGRVVSNRETVEAALRSGPMTADEVAGWRAGTRANEVDFARAGMTFNDSWERFTKGLEAGNATEVKAASEAVDKMMPGFENMRATGGRMTQIQSLFVQNKMAKIAGELADMHKKGVPLDQVRAVWETHKADIARAEATGRIVSSAREVLDKLETFATRMKLTSPITAVWNTTSNALTFLAQRPMQLSAQAAVKVAQGNYKGAAADVRYVFGTTQGLVNGLRRFAAEFSENAPSMGKAEEYARQASRGPLRYLDPFRHLSAQDALWKGILEDAKISTMAYESATKEGLRGDALAKKVAQLVSSPPEAWRAKAELEAAEHTFQSDPGKAMTAVTKAINGIPGMRLVIPFVRTPFNIARYQAQRSPLGVFSNRNISGLMSGGDAQAEAAGRLLSGSALALGSFALVQRGELTGAYPVDAAERARWEAEGRQPYSFRSGKRWIAYNRVSPLGLYLSQAVSFKEMVDAGQNEGAGAMLSKLIVDGGRAVLDMPFMSGMSSMMDAIQDPQREAKRFLQSTATGVLPNVLRDVRIQTDPMRREARGVGQGIANMIPGRSQQLEPSLDVFGRENRYEPNRLLRSLKVVSPVKDTTVSRPGYFPTEPRREVKPARQPARKLEGPEGTRFAREMGAATEEAWRSLIARPGFNDLEQDRQDELLRDAINGARKRVRDRWKRGGRPDTTRASVFGDLAR